LFGIYLYLKLTLKENIMLENTETLAPKEKHVGSHVLQRTVLKKSPKIKLNDFSAALDITKRVKKYKGSRPSSYASPEAILYKNYSTPADMWALGATLFELHTGRSLLSLPSDDNRVELLAALQVSVGAIPRSLLKGEAHLDIQALVRETEKHSQMGSKYTVSLYFFVSII
jgi:serine/threonine protein kinase